MSSYVRPHHMIKVVCSETLIGLVSPLLKKHLINQAVYAESGWLLARLKFVRLECGLFIVSII